MQMSEWLIARVRIYALEEMTAASLCVCQRTFFPSFFFFFSPPWFGSCVASYATLRVTWVASRWGWCASVFAKSPHLFPDMHLPRDKGKTAWKWRSCECVMNVLSVWNGKKKKKMLKARHSKPVWTMQHWLEVTGVQCKRIDYTLSIRKYKM